MSVAAAVCCSQDPASIGSDVLFLSQSQSCPQQSSKGSESQTQKQFNSGSSPTSWHLHLLRNLNVFLSNCETSPSSQWYLGWIMMPGLINSIELCPSFQYFSFHYVYCACCLSCLFQMSNSGKTTCRSSLSHSHSPLGNLRWHLFQTDSLQKEEWEGLILR